MKIKLSMTASTLAAAAASRRGQRWYRRNVKWSLAMLIVASLGGLTEEPIGGWISATAFVLALALTILPPAAALQQAWHEGRAVAERGKSLTWKFAVGGAPFEIGRAEAEEAYAAELKTARAKLKDLGPLAPAQAAGEGRDPREVRATDLAARRAAYMSGRLEEQARWYERRSRALRDAALRWKAAAIVLQLAGVVGAVLKGLDKTDLDWLALFATAAAAVAAWREVDDDQFTARAYELTAIELRERGEREPSVGTEAAWAEYVAAVEAELTHEHTLWATRRQ